MTPHTAVRPRPRPAVAVSAALVLALLAALLVLVTGGSPTASAAPARAGQGTTSSSGAKPTIVMVHGAFADASGWQGVAQRLQKRGYTVYAPPNPLRGLASDSAYLASFLATIPGPVVLVGHSYGGAVITNAAKGNPHVKGLVYVAAYALAEGESAGEAGALGGHPEESQLLANIAPRPYAGAPEGDVDVYIDPAAFHRVFAADLPARQAAFMAAAQRPVTLFSLGAASGPPAWKDVPSWYLVARQDRAIPPTAERAMARRAGSRTVEINSSHVAMISHPGVVTGLVLAAAHRR